MSKKNFLFGALGAMAIVHAATISSTAQTRPRIHDSGVEHPASAIYIGNSFFYYNNSMHNTLLVSCAPRTPPTDSVPPR